MKLISGQVNGSSYKFMATWYKGVKDTTKLVELITTPDFAQTHDFAFINAHSVPGIKCLIAAVNRTIYSKNTFQLKTGNAYTEVIYNLSPSTSIKKSVEAFGINSSTTNIIILRIGDDTDKFESDLRKFNDENNGILGMEWSDITEAEIFNNCNLESLSKIYGFSAELDSPEKISDTICTCISTKGYL